MTLATVMDKSKNKFNIGKEQSNKWREIEIKYRFSCIGGCRNGNDDCNYGNGDGSGYGGGNGDGYGESNSGGYGYGYSCSTGAGYGCGSGTKGGSGDGN